MKIALISGKAQSGKSTFAKIALDYIASNDKVCQKVRTVAKLAFADEVKRIAIQEFGWDGQKDERGRKLLIDIGTTTGRAYDYNIWVSKMIYKLNLSRDLYEYIFIDDVRFPNEIELLKQRFPVVTIRVERPGYDNRLTPEQLHDESETALDDWGQWDYILENSGSLEEYQEAVRATIVELTKEDN